MVTFELQDDYIELCALLKIAGPRLTGGEAKMAIINGQVLVDKKIETRKKCKIKSGQVVRFSGQDIQIL
jgi:ribosome-associated protein